MNFDNLKQATGCAVKTQKSEADARESMLEILNRFESETDFIDNIINQLVIDTVIDMKPTDYDGYEFLVHYDKSDKKEPSWGTYKYRTEDFWYCLSGTTFTRVCRYHSIGIYIHNGKELVSNLVSIPDTSIELSPADIDVVNQHVSWEWLDRHITAWKWWRSSQRFCNADGIIMSVLKDKNIIAHSGKAYSNWSNLDGIVNIFNFYPEGNVKGLEILIDKELKGELDTERAEEFTKAYRTAILDDIKALNLDEALEQIMCEEMKKEDYHKKEKLYCKILVYYDNKAYDLKLDKPNLIVFAPGQSELVFQFGDTKEEIFTFPAKDVLTIPLSETVWKHPEPEKRLCIPSLYLSGFDLMFDDAEDWYEDMSKILKERVEATGLTVQECEACEYEDDVWDFRLTIKNPIYEGDDK